MINKSKWVGRRYNRLLILDVYKEKNDIMVTCKCDCGVVCKKFLSNVSSGKTRSCGCFQKEVIAAGAHTTHGFTKHPLYSVFDGMKKRCYCKTEKAYRNYGARGIKICQEWLADRKNFFDWGVKNGWRPGLTIDRIDNDGDYSPENCRWATTQEQNNNRRNNHYIFINNVKYTIWQAAQKYNIPYARLRARIMRGWSPENAVTKQKKVNQFL